jgi:hypothetical protein
MPTIPKFKKSTKKKLADLLSQAKGQGINGLRTLIRQYTSREFRHQLVLHSPEFFLTYYLGFRLPEHQRRWLQLWSVKYLLELAPRDHGKSWIFSYGQPLYRIYENLIQNHLEAVTYRFLQISKTDEMAGKYAEQVRVTIEENHYLNEDFGDIRDPNNWLKSRFSCKRNIHDSVEKDHTYEKVGVLGGITGGHFETINADDPLDDENTKTIERMATIENWFWGTVWNLREPPTQFRVTGTRKNRRDLYNTLLETRTWKHNVEKAIIKYPMIPDPKNPDKEIEGWVYITDTGRYVRGLQDVKAEEQIVDVELLTDDYEVLWPATEKVNNFGEPLIDTETKKPMVFGWGIRELLMDRVTQGITSFSREKQNEIQEGEGAIFKKDWFYFFDSQQLYLNEEDGYHYLLPEVEEKAA